PLADVCGPPPRLPPHSPHPDTERTPHTFPLTCPINTFYCILRPPFAFNSLVYPPFPRSWGSLRLPSLLNKSAICVGGPCPRASLHTTTTTVQYIDHPETSLQSLGVLLPSTPIPRVSPLLMVDSSLPIPRTPSHT
ncbi:hypothetical protein CRENBAI_007528, partial [Crenichthys baileyi]